MNRFDQETARFLRAIGREFHVHPNDENLQLIADELGKLEGSTDPEATEVVKVPYKKKTDSGEGSAGKKEGKKNTGVRDISHKGSQHD